MIFFGAVFLLSLSLASLPFSHSLSFACIHKSYQLLIACNSYIQIETEKPFELERASDEKKVRVWVCEIEREREREKERKRDA